MAAERNVGHVTAVFHSDIKWLNLIWDGDSPLPGHCKILTPPQSTFCFPLRIPRLLAQGSLSCPERQQAAD